MRGEIKKAGWVEQGETQQKLIRLIQPQRGREDNDVKRQKGKYYRWW